jgi:hypothetical protein
MKSTTRVSGEVASQEAMQSLNLRHSCGFFGAKRMETKVIAIKSELADELRKKEGGKIKTPGDSSEGEPAMAIREMMARAVNARLENHPVACCFGIMADDRSNRSISQKFDAADRYRLATASGKMRVFTFLFLLIARSGSSAQLCQRVYNDHQGAMAVHAKFFVLLPLVLKGRLLLGHCFF